VLEKSLTQFEAIARACLGSARQGGLDHAQTLRVLVHNVLVSPAPLYRIADWAAPIEPSALGLTTAQKTALNDDRVDDLHRCPPRVGVLSEA
jgi:hypothetical protein